eukprot:3046942-Alexandrium_andersonii.AAC.1
MHWETVRIAYEAYVGCWSAVGVCVGCALGPACACLATPFLFAGSRHCRAFGLVRVVAASEGV